MNDPKKILFLGESYRADAITWMNGLREFGNFEIDTWELKTPSLGLRRIRRMFEFLYAPIAIRKFVKKVKPDMVIAERTTSYGFLAALSGVTPIAIAQQGRTDLWPEHSPMLPLKKLIQKHAFRKATLIHAWGPVMTISMREAKVEMDKVLVLPKGINLNRFTYHTPNNPGLISAIVTRSLYPEYRHHTILKAFSLLHEQGIDFVLTIVGSGPELKTLQNLAAHHGISHKVIFTGIIPNSDLPALLQKSNYYISMPVTEGVSASLFEAMASGCYPVVTDIPGNQSWIRNRDNGLLIAKDDYHALAAEILRISTLPDDFEKAVKENRKFIEEHVDYITNMTIIAQKYHDLIKEANGQ
jgi:glycosyltransferase involved in cell wall biosynthesis